MRAVNNEISNSLSLCEYLLVRVAVSFLHHLSESARNHQWSEFSHFSIYGVEREGRKVPEKMIIRNI